MLQDLEEPTKTRYKETRKQRKKEKGERRGETKRKGWMMAREKKEKGRGKTADVTKPISDKPPQTNPIALF